MKNFFTFLKGFLKNPIQNASIVPTCSEAAEKIIFGLDFTKTKCIVEFGPGAGPVTEKIISKISDDTIYLGIDLNEEYIKLLSKKYQKNNIHFVCGDALLYKKYLEDIGYDLEPEVIISTMGHTNFDDELLEKFLEIMIKYQDFGGIFRTIAYIPKKYEKKLGKRLNHKELGSCYNNIPPLWVMGNK